MERDHFNIIMCQSPENISPIYIPFLIDLATGEVYEVGLLRIVFSSEPFSKNSLTERIVESMGKGVQEILLSVTCRKEIFRYGYGGEICGRWFRRTRTGPYRSLYAIRLNSIPVDRTGRDRKGRE